MVERVSHSYMRYPGKRMYLVMDNAPYHHVHPDDSFFARNHTKEEIQAKLVELGVDEITVNPFPEGAPCIEPPAADAPVQDFESWIFFERSTGIYLLVRRWLE